MFSPEGAGEFANCFVRRVVDRFESGMTRAGGGLNPQRRRILKRFDEKLASSGCAREDMFDLERELKVKLIAVDALGGTLWDSGKYDTRPRVVIPCHNGHAWADIPIDPPKVECLRIVDPDTEMALSKARDVVGGACQTTAAQKTLERRTREILVAFAAKAIPSTVRLWMCGQTLVGSNGCLWRSASASDAIDRAFEEEECVHPCDIPDADSVAERVLKKLGVEMTVELQARLKTQDAARKCIERLVGSPLSGRAEREIEELTNAYRLEAGYKRATHSMGGALAYRFGRWFAREKIKPTPEKYRDVWAAAQVESKVWNSKDKAAAESTKHHHLDMRAAYLGCEDSPLGGASDAIDLVREYGFPPSFMRRANTEGVPLGTVLKLTGAVRLSAWGFSREAHPYVVGRVGEHLRENQGWITTPELRDLLDSGDLQDAQAREIVYSLGTKPGIRFPADRDMAVRFIGKCARPGSESSILVRDPNEAAYLCKTLGYTGWLLNFEKANGVHLIQYRGDTTRAQWYHIRAFVLAYTNVALRRMLRRFPREDVIRVCTDAIYVKAIPGGVAGMLVDSAGPIRYGQWRHKIPGYEWRPEAASWKIEHVGRIEPQSGCRPGEAAAPAPLPADVWACAAKRMYLAGQGGSGKTEWAVKTFAGRRLVVLTPENDLAGAHRDNTRLGLRHHQAQTIHRYLCIDPKKRIEEWDPYQLGSRLDGLAEVIIIDECCKVPTRLLQTVLEYLDGRNCQVVCAGDRGQVPPWEDKAGPHEMLVKWAGPMGIRQFNSDYRSLCETCGSPWSVCTCREGPKSGLHTAKGLMWCKSDSRQLEVFRRCIPEVTFEEALKQTTPEDIWICSTNALGGSVGPRLLEHHKTKYPRLPAKIRFDPDESIAHRYRKQGQPIAIPGSKKMVQAYKGTMVEVPIRMVERGLPLEWKYAGWGTVHRIQGKTVQPPGRLFIVEPMLTGWVSNAVYTSVSRVRLLSQLVRVTPPLGVEGPITPTATQARPNSDLIEARLRRYAVEDRKKGRPQYTGAYHKLTVEHVLNMIKAADKKCVVCGVGLLFQGHTRCYGQSFSIDRLDDRQGHYRWNVRLTCLSCNRRHKSVAE